MYSFDLMSSLNINFIKSEKFITIGVDIDVAEFYSNMLDCHVGIRKPTNKSLWCSHLLRGLITLAGILLMLCWRINWMLGFGKSMSPSGNKIHTLVEKQASGEPHKSRSCRNRD
jgi:hypothetical protein